MNTPKPSIRGKTLTSIEIHDREKVLFFAQSGENFEQKLVFGYNKIQQTYRIKGMKEETKSLRATIPSTFNITVVLKDPFTGEEIVGCSLNNKYNGCIQLYNPFMFGNEFLPTNEELAMGMSNEAREEIKKMPEFTNITITDKHHCMIIHMKKDDFGIFNRIDLKTGEYYPYVVDSIDYSVIEYIDYGDRMEE